MEIIIKGSPEEVANLVLQLQGEEEQKTIGFKIKKDDESMSTLFSQIMGIALKGAPRKQEEGEI